MQLTTPLSDREPPPRCNRRLSSIRSNQEKCLGRVIVVFPSSGTLAAENPATRPHTASATILAFSWLTSGRHTGSISSRRRHGYQPAATCLRACNASAHALWPRVPQVVSLLKRWLLGPHRGAVRPEHRNADRDEFTFRFHRRGSRSPGKLRTPPATGRVPTPSQDLI
jgi:hypothetical protein